VSTDDDFVCEMLSYGLVRLFWLRRRQIVSRGRHVREEGDPGRWRRRRRISRHRISLIIRTNHHRSLAK
jgi:hypothetical protein